MLNCDKPDGDHHDNHDDIDDTFPGDRSELKPGYRSELKPGYRSEAPTAEMHPATQFSLMATILTSHYYNQKQFGNLTSDFTESCRQNLSTKRCDRADVMQLTCVR